MLLSNIINNGLSILSQLENRMQMAGTILGGFLINRLSTDSRVHDSAR